jgi:CO/xanthine dehydrogenase FAD-binding subunit
MSWPSPLGGDDAPTIEQIRLRLAYHIAQRTRDAAVAEAVLRNARITRRTLARYACHQPAEARAEGDLHGAGPRRLDLFAAICLAMGEDPGRVLWAATMSGDYPTMLMVLSAEVQLRPRLRVPESLDIGLQILPLRRSA